VWMIRPLPDSDGVLRPDPEWVASQWFKYMGTRRWQRLSNSARKAVREAVDQALLAPSSPVDNPLLPASRTPTTGKPLPVNTQEELQVSRGPVHPQAAARARRKLRLVGDQSP
jgi:hypothetical protein